MMVEFVYMQKQENGIEYVRCPSCDRKVILGSNCNW